MTDSTIPYYIDLGYRYTFGNWFKLVNINNKQLVRTVSRECCTKRLD